MLRPKNFRELRKSLIAQQDKEQEKAQVSRENYLAIEKQPERPRLPLKAYI